MNAADDRCALWWFAAHAAGTVVCESEQEAAELAAQIEFNDEGSIEGVQFADGTTVAREEWAALAAARIKLREDIEAEDEAAAAAAALRPRLLVRSPFSGARATVNAETAPPWLGHRD